MSITYISPTLEALPVNDRPKTVCTTCPASMWFLRKNQKVCFCTRMHTIVHERGDEVIDRCDGRELALLELAAEM
jgi:hypothetical protein